MIAKFASIFLIFLVLSGCDRDFSTTQKDSRKELISARLHDGSPMYRLQVPLAWRRQDPSADFVTDTTLPLCEFFIEEELSLHDRIRISIHSFPSARIEERIPPMAQIARWKRQLSEINQNSTEIIPQAYAGFVGLLFIGSGILKNEGIAVMAWSMQVAPEHYRVLSKIAALTGNPYFQQMHADYTIKATGPQKMMEKHQKALIAFARSFELIEEIPPIVTSSVILGKRL